MSVILVGEDNPYGNDPRYALFHQPAGASGDRLRRILGLSARTYVRLAKRNLCPTDAWSMATARAEAEKILADQQWSTIVMLGSKVKLAFGAPRLEPFAAQGVLVALPHPSGRNLAWNQPGAALRAREVLRRVAPGVPWGELDSAPGRVISTP